MEIRFNGDERDINLLESYGFLVIEYPHTIILKREDLGDSYIEIYKEDWTMEVQRVGEKDFDLEEVLMPLIEDDLVDYGLQIEVEFEDSEYVA